MSACVKCGVYVPVSLMKCVRCTYEDVMAGFPRSSMPYTSTTYAKPPHDEGFGPNYQKVLDEIDKSIQESLFGAVEVPGNIVCERCGKRSNPQVADMKHYICCGKAAVKEVA